MDNAIITIINNPMLTIQILSSIIIILTGCFIGGKRVYGFMESWRQNKNGIENKQTSVEERLTALEEKDKEQMGRLDTIDGRLQEIIATLEMMTEDNKANTVATCRSAIYRWYAEFQNRDSLTSAEYEMFMDLANRYLACDGNSVFKDKIIPYVKNMKVID